MEPISVGDLLAECNAMMEPLAAKRGIAMTFSTPDHPCFVLADGMRLKQVVVNLISNAVKYNRENGSLAVRCFEPSPGWIRIAVTDTGMGLPTEQLAQLFQPFNRLGREAGAEQGTGIELVVTKRLVDAMHGKIGVDSEVGVGSVFHVDLARAVRRSSNPPTRRILSSMTRMWAARSARECHWADGIFDPPPKIAGTPSAPGGSAGSGNALFSPATRDCPVSRPRG